MIFDTDVLIWASRGNLRAARAIDGDTSRALTVISLMELLQGARSKRESQHIRRSLSELQFQVLPLSESIGATATIIIEEHAQSHGMQLADALIAATAIEAGLPLCTANVKHFRPLAALTLVPFRP